MSKRSEENRGFEALREKIIGLGERSARKSYYAKLKENIAELERFRALLDQTTDSIFLMQAPSGRLVDVNESACRQLERSREDLLSLPVEALWPNSISELLMGLLRGPHGIGNPQILDVDMVTSNGRRFPAEVSFRQVNFNDTDYVVAVARDVTERKIAEEALRESEHRFRTLVESCPLGIAFYDWEGRIVELNPALPEIMGSPSQEATKAINLFTFPPMVEGGLSEALYKCLVSERPFVGEFPYTSKWGKDLHMRLHVTPIRLGEKRVIGGQILVEDITESKRLEEQVRQKAKLEAIGRLAGGVAHDFNNLLTAVLGYANMVEQQLPAESPMRDKLVQISLAAGRATSLTGQLLAFSRKQMLNVRSLNLNQAVTEFEDMVRRLIGEDIDVATLLDPDLRNVPADAGQIEQILMNLAVNARDSMPGGGTLTIETANTALNEEYCRNHPDVEPGEYVMLAVADTGTGMDRDTQSRLFEPFFTTKAKGLGTGLGMSTVYGVVKQHRGHIAVYSEPGRGTIIRVYLPQLDGPPADDTERLPSKPPRRGHETILVVEDEEMVRTLACEALELLGYSPLSAASPSEAIRVCRTFEGRIDLLLTDVVLPQMDGRSLYDLLSTIRPDMKVLYVSGYTEDFIVHRGVLEKGVNFLAKPFTMETLATKLGEVLGEG
ncbi:MAG: PAS domain S-box protein [Desulfomonilaceae bacterium]|nr:PAS domain S-box protein [Desulfomonilaceae bacterium]